MRITSLRAFLLAFSHKSITRAAREMHLTQPALTKIIHLLEDDLGVELFQRTARGLEPNHYGHAFAPYAKRVVTELEAARKELQAISRGETGGLRVGADSYVVNEILPAAITHLMSVIPNLRIEIATNVSDRLIEAAADGDIDLCITSVSRRSKLHTLSTVVLLQEKYSVVARADHPLTTRDDVQLTEIVDYPWVHVGSDFPSASNLVPVLQAHGVALPKTIIEADSLAYVVAHLRNSDSLSFQPRRLINAAGIAEIRIRDASLILPPFKIVAGRMKDQPLSGGARRLLAELADFLQTTDDLHELMVSKAQEQLGALCERAAPYRAAAR